MRLILIRHGETDYNRQRRYCGSTDIDLNKKGKWQAARLSKKLAKEKIYKVYSSDMRRTRNFTQLVIKNKAVEDIPEFREINFGILEGLKHREAMEKYPAIYTRWLKYPLSNLIPEAESLGNFAKRIKKTFSKILLLHKKGTIAIFTHAGPIRVFLSPILKVKLKDIWQIRQDSACINIVEFKKKEGKILLLNDTSYLYE